MKRRRRRKTSTYILTICTDSPLSLPPSLSPSLPPLSLSLCLFLSVSPFLSLSLSICLSVCRSLSLHLTLSSLSLPPSVSVSPCPSLRLTLSSHDLSSGHSESQGTTTCSTDCHCTTAEGIHACFASPDISRLLIFLTRGDNRVILLVFTRFTLCHWLIARLYSLSI